jgi:hypothetical protein
MSDVARRSGSQPVAPGKTTTKAVKKSLVPCWMLLKPHTFAGDQEYKPGRKLSMKRRCSVCGQNVKGGEILLKEDPS